MLKTRLLVSSTYGTKVLNNEDQLSTIFDHWKNHLNVEYVMVTEDLINDGNHNFHSIFSIYIQKNCQMTEFRTAHCDLTEKKNFNFLFYRNDKTSEGRRFKLWKKNIWIPLFKASFCSIPPLWPTVQFKTRHGDLDQTSWHPWHTCSTCQCWTNWQVRILKIRLWAILWLRYHVVVYFWPTKHAC